ncbi:MAG TPA: hypothetical protein VGD37_06120 [Kofleriaceae bacterium]
MASNQIRAVTFRPVADAADGAQEGGHALFMALDIADPDRLVGFLEDVVTRFKLERMSGPPDARFMLITVVGDVPAPEFADAWRAATAHDAPARALLGAMHQADVMQGDPQGRVLGQASLLASSPPPARVEDRRRSVTRG